MFNDFLASGDLTVLPIFGLGIFLSVFAGVLIYVAVGLKRGPALDHVASLPLQEDDDDSDASTAMPGPATKKGAAR